MKNVVLFSTGCPKCSVLEQKLKQRNINYSTISEIEVIANKGFLTVPVLDVDGKFMEFLDAVKWINGQEVID